MCYTRSRYTSELCQFIRVCMLSCLHKVRMCCLLFLLGLFLMNMLLFKITSFSRISAPGSKQKSTSDDRDSALVALLQEKSWGRLGPQWIRPNPPRLHILDGEVTYSAKSCIFIPVLLLIWLYLLWKYSYSGWILTTIMSYYGIIACVLKRVVGLRSVIWLPEP